MKNRKAELAAPLKGVLLGLLVGLAILAGGCALAAACIGAQKLPESALRYCAWAICTLGAAGGSIAAQKLARRARLPVSLGTCALTLVLLALIRALLRTGSDAVWHPALAAVLCAVGCAFAGAGRGR